MDLRLDAFGAPLKGVVAAPPIFAAFNDISPADFKHLPDQGQNGLHRLPEIFSAVKNIKRPRNQGGKIPLLQTVRINLRPADCRFLLRSADKPIQHLILIADRLLFACCLGPVKGTVGVFK